MAREELSAGIHSAQSTQYLIRYIKVVPSFYSYCLVGEERGGQQLAVCIFERGLSGYTSERL